MKTTVEALKDYYEEIGGNLEDVANITTIPDMIEAITALGGGSSLPDVTAEDAGKVLTVNNSGEWSAAAPKADESTLVIPATVNTSNYNVTFAETTSDIITKIRSAIGTGKNIMIMGDLGGTDFRLFQFVTMSSQSSATFESIVRSGNSTIYWTISFTGTQSKTTQFTSKTVNDPA